MSRTLTRLSTVTAIAASALGAATLPASADTTPANHGIYSIQSTVQSEAQAASGAWQDYMGAQPGHTIRVLITFANTSTDPHAIERSVHVSVGLPQGAIIVGRGSLMNALSPKGTPVSAKSLTHVTDIGDYGPQTNGYITFLLRMPRAVQVPCGTTPVTLHLTEQLGSLRARSVLHLHTAKICPTSMTKVTAPPR